MKLPYREGDVFALPLGDGSSARAQIVACGHHTVDVVVQNGETTLPVARVSDRALVLQRWKRASGPPTAARAACDAPSHPLRAGAWMGPARFERTIATHLGIAQLELPPLIVRGGAPPPRRKVHCLHLPRGGVIESIGARIERIEDLAALTEVHALRVARVARFDLALLRNVRVTALALESIADLRAVETLAQRSDLRQLEMLDLWSCELGEVMPLAAMPNLLRAEIDIGGRRKNIELNRHANWAYPWPMDILAELAETPPP